MEARRKFVDSIGRQLLKERLQQSDQAITNAIKRGLPARWYVVCLELATAAGVDCPPEIFGMIAFDDQPGTSKA